jgi:hypothetical protein
MLVLLPLLFADLMAAALVKLHRASARPYHVGDLNERKTR